MISSYFSALEVVMTLATLTALSAALRPANPVPCPVTASRSNMTERRS